MSESNNKPCANCQERINKIKTEHKNEEWMGEVIDEIEKGCLETFTGDWGHTEHIAMDSININKCSSCGETVRIHHFTSFKKDTKNHSSSSYMIKKEKKHACSKEDKQRERERERETKIGVPGVPNALNGLIL